MDGHFEPLESQYLIQRNEEGRAAWLVIEQRRHEWALRQPVKGQAMGIAGRTRSRHRSARNADRAGTTSSSERQVRLEHSHFSPPSRSSEKSYRQ